MGNNKWKRGEAKHEIIINYLWPLLMMIRTIDDGQNGTIDDEQNCNQELRSIK